jgi:PAS domain-containing protein
LRDKFTGHVTRLAGRVRELELSLQLYQEESIRRRFLLENSRDYLQSVIDNIGDPILVIDPKYRVVLANKKLREASKCDPVKDGLLCHELTRLGNMPFKDNSQPCALKR